MTQVSDVTPGPLVYVSKSTIKVKATKKNYFTVDASCKIT
jgi:hypothetical protein